VTATGIVGPTAATTADIPALNQVFSEAFTERYRRDGMVGVRVPTLNPSIWRFSLDDAADGAMLWRDADGGIVAFNVAHCSGTEGWMGPLAVRPDAQGQGLGKAIVQEGIAWLRRAGARVIGLETMPRTVDNIGFYSSLGFVAGRLTVTFTLDATNGNAVDRIGRHGAAEQASLLDECAALTRAAMPGYDYTREVLLTTSLGLGDTVLVRDGPTLVGFALCHAAPLTEGRAREELRVLKVVLSDVGHTRALVRAITAFARESGTLRAALRVQSEYEAAYREVVAAGGRARWTDLRMTLHGFAERRAHPGVVFSNWEI
jgi:GNAT superfamily N-acetyltransferase